MTTSKKAFDNIVKNIVYEDSMKEISDISEKWSIGGLTNIQAITQIKKIMGSLK